RGCRSGPPPGRVSPGRPPRLLRPTASAGDPRPRSKNGCPGFRLARRRDIWLAGPQGRAPPPPFAFVRPRVRPAGAARGRLARPVAVAPRRGRLLIGSAHPPCLVATI